VIAAIGGFQPVQAVVLGRKSETLPLIHTDSTDRKNQQQDLLPKISADKLGSEKAVNSFIFFCKFPLPNRSFTDEAVQLSAIY
jgi:hypothetical protein